MNSSSAVRTTGRVKKPKAVFDPSDNYLPRSYRSNVGVTTTLVTTTVRANPSPSSTLSATSPPKDSISYSLPDAPADVCSKCNKAEVKRGSCIRNKLFACCKCDKKIHKLCLDFDFENLEKLRQAYKCDTCRTCDICDAFTDVDDDMITCVKCINSYHLGCHIPHVLASKKLERSWKCKKCLSLTIANGKSNVSIAPVKTYLDSGASKRRKSEQRLPDANDSASADASIKSIPKHKINGIANGNAKRKASSPARKIPSPPTRKLTSSPAAKLISPPAPKLTSPPAPKPTSPPAPKLISPPAPKLTSPPAPKPTSPPAAKLISPPAPKLTSPPAPKLTSPPAGKLTSPPARKLTSSPARKLTSSPARKLTSPPVAQNTLDVPFEIPDVRPWSVNQVTEYFSKFFPNEAYIFQEYEIDGLSLLLLTRNDVIKKIPNKLGPLLRIYSLILMLQSQVYDITLGWNS